MTMVASRSLRINAGCPMPRSPAVVGVRPAVHGLWVAARPDKELDIVWEIAPARSCTVIRATELGGDACGFRRLTWPSSATRTTSIRRSGRCCAASSTARSSHRGAGQLHSGELWWFALSPTRSSLCCRFHRGPRATAHFFFHRTGRRMATRPSSGT